MREWWKPGLSNLITLFPVDVVQIMKMVSQMSTQVIDRICSCLFSPKFFLSAKWLLNSC